MFFLAHFIKLAVVRVRALWEVVKPFIIQFSLTLLLDLLFPPRPEPQYRVIGA